jgi:alpha-methylacyl-CoA racemase
VADATHDPPPGDGPLAGILVVDCSRMLPGAVTARVLLDLGARLVKVEDPQGGDLMRRVPPLVDGIGAGFCAFFRGAESVALDLRVPSGAEALQELARRADVLVESFRPGTMEVWGVGLDRLHDLNPALVSCSLSAYGSTAGAAEPPGHDLNFVGLTGALTLLGTEGVPGVQLADVTAGLLAAAGILAALLQRHRTGRGHRFEQPLAAAPLPFLTWAWADAAAGGASVASELLGGRCPAYHRYRCADGREISVAAVEPKFWSAFTEALGLPHLAGAGLDVGERGRRAAETVAAVVAAKPSSTWLELARRRGLPIAPVATVAEATILDLFEAAGWVERTPTSAGPPLRIPAPFLGGLGRTPARPAPRLGEHTHEVLRSINLDAP